MQKGKQALLLHLGVCLRLCSTISLPCRYLLHLTTLPHTPRTLFFFSSAFHSLLTLFIYPHTSAPLFRFPSLHEVHPSPTPPLHLIFFPPRPPRSLSPVNFPRLFYLPLFSPCSNAHVGTTGIMPVVLWPWPGGQFLGPEGCCPSCLRKLGVLWQCAGLEGWTAGGLEARGGRQGPRRSQPFKTLAPGSKVRGERGSCFWSRKRALVSPWLTKDTAMQPAKQTLPNNNPIVLLSCDYILCVPICTATGIITFVLQHCNNIWCLFLINQAVSVHICNAVAADI